MRASVPILACLAFPVMLAGAMPFAGCGADEGGGVLGRPPTTRVIHLEELGEARPREGAPSPGAQRLLALEGEQLSGWKRRVGPDGVRFESPPLGEDGLPDAGALRLRVVPGGATRVSVIPRLRETRVAREDRALRRVDLSLERDAAPDAPVSIAVDLHEAIHANLGDAGRGARLERLELLLPGADPARAALESVVIERLGPLPPERDAASRIADQGDVLRPSWVVRGGAAVEIPLRLPADSPELRWSDGAIPGTGERRISVVAEDGVTSLATEPPVTDGSARADWTSRRVPLSRFAGREVTLRLEVAGDGVGLFGSPTVVAGRDDRAPDVLLYLIDTLRGDHLGAAGPDRPPVSPNLDRLAREGVWFRRAQSSSSWTKPAIATLFSGVLPTTHRVGATSYTDRMPASVPLVQERFRAAGWRTASFSASPLGSTLSALERGFDTAYPPRFWRTPQLGLNPAAGQLHETLLDWVAEQPDRPFFAYVHTLEVHEWKLPRYRDEGPAGTGAYDAAILDADQQLGILLARLEQARPERNLVVVVVSDHGESWGDHGLPSHGFGLYQSQIHIPLIFWTSDGRLPPRTVEVPVSLADLGPTLLDAFGLPPLEDVDGHSLAPSFVGEAVARGPVLSSLLRFVWAPDAPRQYAVTTPERVVRIRDEGGPDESYDLVLDPDETSPLRGDPSALDRVLDELLEAQRRRADEFATRHGPITPGAVTADESARLRALGYLEVHDDATGAADGREDDATPPRP